MPWKPIPDKLRHQNNKLSTIMKRFVLCAAFAASVLASYAGTLEFTTSCGDSYIVRYPSELSSVELAECLMALDEVLC